MALIPKPAFPNVPNLPGVPQVPRSPSVPPTVVSAVSAGLGVAALWKALFSAPQWAIYKAVTTTRGADGVDEVTVTDRKAVVVPDSFGEFTYRNEFTTSDFPVEQGQFASYNKVAHPFEVSVRMYKGGTKESRQEFLDSIDAIVGDLNLYDIMTPEKVYLNVNVTRFEVARRGASGAYFFSEVDLYFRVIRQVSSSYTSTSVSTENAKNADAVSVQNNGVKQAQTTTASPSDVGL